MRYEELRQELKNISFVTVREESNVYFEAVIPNSELSKIATKLDTFFGPRIWPSENKLPEEVQSSIKEFGGIMPGQILYFSKQDTEVIFVMLWPWSNGTHITVKVAQA